MHRLKWILVGVASTLILAFGANAIASSLGGWPSNPGDQRHYAVDERAAVFQRAANLLPDPVTVNFPLRRMLIEMTKREDLLNHPWYVYMLGMNGNVIGYYVAKTTPINACDFLSSTEDIWTNDKSSQKMTAPSLDGIYYGGGGVTGGCDTYVFQDYATGAIIKIKGVNFYTADAPLKLQADPIKVTSKK